MIYICKNEQGHHIDNIRSICYIIPLYIIRYHQKDYDIDGLAQDCNNSIANALELLRFCTKLSIGLSPVRRLSLVPFMVSSPSPGPLFTRRTDVLPQDLVKSRRREIRVQTFPIALKFDRHLGSSAAKLPVKFQSDVFITSDLHKWLSMV